MVIRYMKQRDYFSCGPVAIMNSLKWAGVPCSYEKIKLFRDLCFCTHEGTSHRPFDEALRIAADLSEELTVRRVYRPTLKQITDHLEDDGLIILNYFWRRKSGCSRHFFILDGISPTGKTLYTVNGYAIGAARQAIRRRTFVKEILKFQRFDPHYKGWFLQRRES